MLTFTKAIERTLLVKRKLINSDDLVFWAKLNGFPTTIPEDDMHVTVAFSKNPLEWPEPDTNNVVVAGGSREMALFGEGAKVLCFESIELQTRWQILKDLGATWDYGSYVPHVTITYADANDRSSVYAYAGVLIFGPEEFSEINPDWKSNITEKNMQIEASDVHDWLKKNAPDIAALMEKDATVGDVHAATSLGPKKKPFDAMMEGLKTNDTTDDVDKGEADWNIPFEIQKADPERQMIFGWASIAVKGGKTIVDKQGDMISVSELENAVYKYTMDSRQHGDMHETVGHGQFVEGVMFTPEKAEKGLVAFDPVTKEQIYGWWAGFKVIDPKLWDAHKRGERPEFSIGGRGRRVPA